MNEANAILEEYAAGPDRLEAALQGLDEADLDLALSDDSWSIRQIVHHLADGDALWKIAILAALGESRGPFGFGWYWEIEQDQWAETWGYAGRAIGPSLALFRANRQHTVHLLQSLPDAWERTVRITLLDGRQRPASVSYIVEMQAQHVTDHLADIGRILQAQPGATHL